jgi:hypothetical protein
MSGSTGGMTRRFGADSDGFFGVAVSRAPRRVADLAR